MLREYRIHCYLNQGEFAENSKEDDFGSYFKYRHGDLVELVVTDVKSDKDVLTIGINSKGFVGFHRGR